MSVHVKWWHYLFKIFEEKAFTHTTDSKEEIAKQTHTRTLRTSRREKKPSFGYYLQFFLSVKFDRFGALVNSFVVLQQFRLLFDLFDLCAYGFPLNPNNSNICTLYNVHATWCIQTHTHTYRHVQSKRQKKETIAPLGKFTTLEFSLRGALFRIWNFIAFYFIVLKIKLFPFWP